MLYIILLSFLLSGCEPFIIGSIFSGFLAGSGVLFYYHQKHEGIPGMIKKIQNSSHIIELLKSFQTDNIVICLIEETPVLISCSDDKNILKIQAVLQSEFGKVESLVLTHVEGDFNKKLAFQLKVQLAKYKEIQSKNYSIFVVTSYDKKENYVFVCGIALSEAEKEMVIQKISLDSRVNILKYYIKVAA